MSTQKICGRNLGECEKLLSKQTIKECFPCSSKIPCEKFIKFLTSILSNHQMVLTLVQMQLFTMCNVVATLKFFSLVFGDFLKSLTVSMESLLIKFQFHACNASQHLIKIFINQYSNPHKFPEHWQQGVKTRRKLCHKVAIMVQRATL